MTGRHSQLEMALFVNLPSITELTHTSAPSSIAAGPQTLPHQRLHSVLIKAVQAFDLLKAGMIAQRHLNNFAERHGVWGKFCHIQKSVVLPLSFKWP